MVGYYYQQQLYLFLTSRGYPLTPPTHLLLKYCYNMLYFIYYYQQSSSNHCCSVESSFLANYFISLPRPHPKICMPTISVGWGQVKNHKISPHHAKASRPTLISDPRRAEKEKVVLFFYILQCTSHTLLTIQTKERGY